MMTFTEGGNCTLTLTGRTTSPSPEWIVRQGFGMPISSVHDSIRVTVKYDYARAERASVRVHGCLHGVKVAFADGRRRPRRVTKKLKTRHGIRTHAAARFVRTELTP